ncbi:MAG: GAF domain-containing protein [Anaerolineae bacterium]|nr:GAF domain-containing protein [Anaerolineae bacterium]
MSEPSLTDWVQERDRQRLRVLNALLLVGAIGGGVAALTALIAILQNPDRLVNEGRILIAYLVILVAAMVRRLDYRLRLFVPVVVLYFLGINATSAQGIASHGVWFLLLAPLVLFPLAGWRMGTFSLFLSALIFIFFAVGQFMRWLPLDSLPDPRTPAILARFSAVYLALLAGIGAIQGVFNHHQERALQTTSVHAAELAQAREKLQEHTAELLHTNERLRTQSWLLNTAAYLIGEISALDDLETLFAHVVQILQRRFQRFGVECVGIFMQDPETLTEQTPETAPLLLFALSGKEVLPLRSVNVSATVSKAAQSGEVAFGPCSLESETGVTQTYELAIPLRPHLHADRADLISRGVLYFCNTTQALFEDLDEAVWMTLSSQLSVAMQNVHLLQQARGEVREMRLVQQQYTERSWRDLFLDTAVFTYRADGRTADNPPLTPEVVAALREERVIVRSGSRSARGAIIVPIKVRGAVLGVVEIQSAEPGTVWSREQLDLVDTVVDQLGVALDSARLYQESLRRATREQLTREITDEMRRSITMETILRTAVEKLGQAIGVPQAYVRLKLNEEPEPVSPTASATQEGDESHASQ